MREGAGEQVSCPNREGEGRFEQTGLNQKPFLATRLPFPSSPHLFISARQQTPGTTLSSSGFCLSLSAIRQMLPPL